MPFISVCLWGRSHVLLSIQAEWILKLVLTISCHHQFFGIGLVLIPMLIFFLTVLHSRRHKITSAGKRLDSV